MVGWGPDQADVENSQKVASSEGEELWVCTFPFHTPFLRPWTSANKSIARKLLEKSELLKGLMQGMYSLSWFGRVVY